MKQSKCDMTNANLDVLHIDNRKPAPVFDPKALLRLVMTIGFVAFLAMLVSFMPRKAHASAEYSVQEIVNAGHGFFGATSGGLAQAIERIFASHGLPNGYILGQEAGAAFVGGLTYGEGSLYTKNAGDHNVFWQGPSVGWDFGGEGSRTMMLVYDLDAVPSLYRRFAGVSGSAYAIAGIGVNILKAGNIMLVPVRTGVGARLGVNIGYLKLTQQATWNPF